MASKRKKKPEAEKKAKKTEAQSDPAEEAKRRELAEKFVSAIEKQLRTLHAWQQELRKISDVPQWREKLIVAKHYGLPQEEVMNLPFEPWMELRERYERETGNSL